MTLHFEYKLNCPKKKVSFHFEQILKMSFKCSLCKTNFSRKNDLQRHFNRKHLSSKNIINCFLCGLLFEDVLKLDEHYENIHKSSNYFEVKESAFKRNVIVYRYLYSKSKHISLGDSQNSFIKKEIKKVIYHEAAKKNIIKYSIILIADLKMLDNTNDIISKATIPFRSKTFTSVPLEKNRIRESIEIAMQEHTNKIEAFIQNGSNWIFDRPLAIDIEICGLNSLVMGCSEYSSIDLKLLRNRRHLVNVPSKKNQCLLYCIAEALYGKDILDKKSHRPLKKYVKKFNINGINFPTTLKDVRKFVSLNEVFNIKLNIIFLSENKIYPIESSIGNGKNVINLLIVPISKDNSSIHHFLLIKNLDKFLSKVYKNENGRNYYTDSFYCTNCLNKFYTKSNRDKHYQRCILNKAQIEKVPDERNNIIKFEKYENQFYENLVGYLDFESSLEKLGNKCETCNTLRCKCDYSYTRYENIQKPICFSFIIVDKNNKIVYEKNYSGKNAADVFLNDLLLQEKVWIKGKLNEIIKMNKLNEVEEIMHEISQSCYMCNKVFTVQDEKVHDHDHSTGCYISAAHRSCNLRRRRQKCLKIFMHSGSRYDFHFIVKSLAKREVKNLYILPYNMENFRMVKFNSFMLLDSLAFLPSSLSKLSEDLKLSKHDYPVLKNAKLVQTNGKFDTEKFEMSIQKGFFCYEYW